MIETFIFSTKYYLCLMLITAIHVKTFYEVPAQENINRTEPYVETKTLAAIVEEIMKSEKGLLIYSNDSSSRNKVGS